MPLLFFLIAWVYSMAGFGGGSSYLAVLSLFSVEFRLMRAVSLLCNIAVVSGNVWIFQRGHFLNWRKILPLTIASVPMAFVGGLTPLREKYFFILLGGLLLLAGLAMFFQNRIQPKPGAAAFAERHRKWLDPGIGATIGYLSGLVGIGGGIFLSPVLHLMQWANPKSVSGTASFFILVNSVAGLAGQLIKADFTMDWKFVFWLVGAVIAGGQVGARISAFRLSESMVRLTTASVISYVAVRLLWKYLF